MNMDDDLVCEDFACPKCGERRMGCLINEEGHVVCDSCGHEYDLDTFAVMNPWTKEIVEVSISEVTQEKLDFLATLMDDEIREAIHNGDCPTIPGAFFKKYAEIVGAEEAGKIWFA